jgi:beta-glucosidase
MASITASVFTALTLLSTSFGQKTITNDTTFYGQSPEIPAPIADGAGPWADAYSKAKSFVAQLTLEEKVNLTGGIRAPNGCSGNIPAISRLGFEGMCLTDAGNGVRATDFVNGWPSGIHVGARSELKTHCR